MAYDIYFHNDFDGRASAAVMLAFLQSRGDKIEHYVPVDFYLEKEWLREGFFKTNKLVSGRRNPAIVVDFPYHPAAAFWFDHHSTGIKKESWRKRFKPSKFHVLDPQQPSCCRVVINALRKNFGWKLPRRMQTLARAADLIDGAQFKNPKQTITLRDPATAIDAFIDETRTDPKLARWIIKLFAEKSFIGIASLPRIQKAAKKARARNLKALRFYEKNLKVLTNTAFIDLTHHSQDFLRYAPYYLCPNIVFAVRFIKKDGGYGLRVGANPWRKGSPRSKIIGIHLGKLCARYGGGGHKDAAGINCATRKEIEAIVPKIFERLTKAGG